MAFPLDNYGRWERQAIREKHLEKSKVAENAQFLYFQNLVVIKKSQESSPNTQTGAWDTIPLPI
jgi:hypothetical protein